MNEKIEKLIKLSGDKNLYQYLALFIVALLWGNASTIFISLPLLEDPPVVQYTNETGHLINDTMNYDMCKWEDNYTIIEHHKYSWISDFHLECDEYKTGLLGSMNSFGYMVGSFTFSFVTKQFSTKTTILGSIIAYIIIILAMNIFRTYYVILISMIFTGLLADFINLSSLVLVEETVCKERRAIFSSIIGIAFTIGAIIYFPLFAIFERWYVVFYFLAGIFLINGILVHLFLYNSPRVYMKSNQRDTMLSILRGMAKINGRLDEFNTAIETTEYKEILESLSNDDTKKDNETLNEKKKKKINGWAFFKYPSIRYTFLIFCLMFYVTSGIYSGITLSIKLLGGNIYLNMAFSYFVESVSSLGAGLLMDSTFGRKVSLLSMYILAALCLITNQIVKSENEIFQLIISLAFRFCISAICVVFYSYTLELYPAPIRSTGFGINMTCGEIGGFTTSLIVELVKEKYVQIGYITMCSICAFLGFFLKETAGQPMEETIKEIEEEELPQTEVPLKECDE